MVTDTRKVLYTTAADHNYGVLLKVMTDTGDISCDFVTVGQTYTGDLTQSGVRLLRGRSTDCGADASLLGGAEIGFLIFKSVQTLLHCRGCGLIGDLLSALSHQLIKGWHCVLLSFVVVGPGNFNIKKANFDAFLCIMNMRIIIPTQLMILAYFTKIVKKFC